MTLTNLLKMKDEETDFCNFNIDKHYDGSKST